MKKSVLIATGLALLSTSAYATQSRMTALGQDVQRGSHYIDDSRNVFRNAAHAGSMTNYIVTEWSTGSDAEGGFFKEAGSFNYGVYLNSEADSQNTQATTVSTNNYGGSTIATGSTGFVSRSDNLDLFFAGDMGFQWGARLSYTKSNQKNAAPALDATHDGMGLGLGVVFGDIEGSVNFVLKDDYENDAGATTAGEKAEGSNMNVNLAYHWGSWTFFVGYEALGMEYTSAAGAAKNETTQNTIEVGAGHIHEVSSTARVFTDVQYRSRKGEDKDGTTAANNQERTRGALEVNLGFEADATSWLTWRGSITQNVIIDKDETKVGAATTETDDTSTGVVAGATLNFGKLKVDGNIGTTSKTLRTDNLLTEVAVHYWF